MAWAALSVMVAVRSPLPTLLLTTRRSETLQRETNSAAKHRVDDAALTEFSLKMFLDFALASLGELLPSFGHVFQVLTVFWRGRSGQCTALSRVLPVFFDLFHARAHIRNAPKLHAERAK